MKKLLKKTLWGYILTYAVTFLMVIGLLIPIYSMAYNSSRRVIEQNLTSSLSAGTERLAVALHAADLYAYSLMEQDEMVDIAYRANIKNSHRINARQLQEKLIDPFSTSADYAQLCAGRFECPLVYILFKGGFIHDDHCAALAARAHGAERQLVYD